jgi:two-component system sensor histidine kinase BaeS
VRWSMRPRLMFAMVGLVAGVLVIAGAGSLVLTRNAARNQAQQQLVSEARSLTDSKTAAHSLRVLDVVRRTLKLEDAGVIRITRFGTVVGPLPEGLTPADIDVSGVQSGQTSSGRKGSLVYAVAPVSLSTTAQIQALRRQRFGGTYAVLLTRDVGDLGPSWGYFILAGGAALVVAALVAWQMSRRMAGPLVEAEEATGRIAGGELSSRVPIRPRDYPELASLAGSINRMAQSLEEGRARERHLLLSVSHDLRTPLTSIRGFAEAIQDGAVEDSGRAAEVIVTESRRLERLVGDLLDLTKLEARQMSISMRPTDIAEVVTSTVEAFRPTAAQSGRSLEVYLPTAPIVSGAETTSTVSRGQTGPWVAADPDRMAQLLANLLENAMAYARTTVDVTVADLAPDGAVVITVDDDGQGIGPEHLERVFERFYRADSGQSRHVGSGLGLAIVAELAAAMGMTVGAESPLGPNGGTRFVVRLRAWPVATDSKPALPAPPPPWPDRTPSGAPGAR